MRAWAAGVQYIGDGTTEPETETNNKNAGKRERDVDVGVRGNL